MHQHERRYEISNTEYNYLLNYENRDDISFTDEKLIMRYSLLILAYPDLKHWM